MTKNEHIPIQELKRFTVSADPSTLLKHISSCPICAARLAQVLSEQEIISAPRYLKQQILNKTKRLQQKKREFHIYCMKIGFAVAASLAVILFSGIDDNTSFMENLSPKPYTQQTQERQDTAELSRKIYQSTDKLNQKILNFTDRLFH